MDLFATQNTYLALIAGENSKFITDNVELVEFARQRNAHTPPGLYFPLTCVLSLEKPLSDGSTVMMRLIGADGIANFIDRDFDLNPVTVLKAGVAARLRNDGLEHAMAKDPGRVQPMLDLYRCRTAQYALNTCCFARHPLTQRISRLLLRAGISFGRGNDITLTQEEIARLVATRRETVTDILNRFAREGVIELHRSVIRILRRDILRTHSCDCFTVEMKLEKNCAQSIASMFRGFEYGASADKRQRPNESITAGAA
jgi:hypothetical protein